VIINNLMGIGYSIMWE